MEKVHENVHVEFKHKNMHVSVYIFHLVPTSPPHTLYHSGKVSFAVHFLIHLMLS